MGVRFKINYGTTITGRYNGDEYECFIRDSYYERGVRIRVYALGLDDGAKWWAQYNPELGGFDLFRKSGRKVGGGVRRYA